MAPNDHRPDPDALLAKVRAQQDRKERGKLKVFFGACAGVGKTYAMLEAARARLADGVDVVAGVVETHKRAETESLLEGIPALPRRKLDHRGVQLGRIRPGRRPPAPPALVLVDELAHTNAPGSRHAKRWQDVKELLDNGIDVHTTVNVQHIDSLNDVVAQVTTVQVRETVPDSVLEDADEIVLVDLPPEELLERLRDGKVYVPEQAKRAAESFFRPGNLAALRELSLRFLANRVNAQVQVYRDSHAIRGIWPTAERLLVCVGRAQPPPSSSAPPAALRRSCMRSGSPSPWSLRRQSAARAGARGCRGKPRACGASWCGSGDHNRRERGGGGRPSREGAECHQIVVGKAAGPRWREILGRTLVDEIVRRSGDIDVYVIRGDGEPTPPVRANLAGVPQSWHPYRVALFAVAVCTALAWAMYPHFALADLIMVYLAGIAFTATRGSRRAALLSTLLSLVTFDLLFVPPRFTISVEGAHYLATFVVMFVVAMVISSLALRLRQQVDLARKNEERTAALHRLSKRLAGARGMAAIVDIAADEVAAAQGDSVAIWLPDTRGRLSPRASRPRSAEHPPKDHGVAQWVLDNCQVAGFGTDTLSSSDSVFLPLVAGQAAAGVLSVRPPAGQQSLYPDQMRLLDAMASQIGLAIEVERLEEEGQAIQSEAQAERLRSSILSSLSHDLRTPLASIVGSASSLLEESAPLSDDTKRELARTIREEADRLDRLISNLLDLTRIEGAGLHLRLDAVPVDELVGTALRVMANSLAARQVDIQIPADLPFVSADEILTQHVVLNLLENALKYSPSGTSIGIEARVVGDVVEIEFGDHGPGIAPGEEELIFEKFARGSASTGRGGAGLGLTICRSIVEAHGGTVRAANRRGGGALFCFTLPVAQVCGPPPEVNGTEAPAAPSAETRGRVR